MKAIKKEYKRTRPNQKRKSPDAQLLTPIESTRITGLGSSMTFKLVREKRIPTVQFGGRVFIPRQALFEWLASLGKGNEAA